MGRVQILDCTLRDGGYCNDCHFEIENEKKIVNSLVEANIDLIECGFFRESVEYNENYTRFNSLNQVRKIIPPNREGKIFVVLADYGKFVPEKLPDFDGSSVDGIRVAFHKKDMNGGLEACRRVKEKGYKVFVQAMVSVAYTDEEFLGLIQSVNEIEPYAFYIVDSFGMLKRKDLTRLFYLVEHNLKPSIWIGFHSHNNMQLAYSNAQSLVEMQTNRNLIVDSSIYGMGRGAGNLNTELFVQYLNENAGGKYRLEPLLEVIDDIINDFYQKNYWGYSLSNYLSASHNAHPNYAGYLDDKKTLTIGAMNEIFELMDEQKKNVFDKKYIEELYLRYMDIGNVQEEHKDEMKKQLSGKTVLLVAPGKSSVDERKKIADFVCKEKVITISVNFCYSETEVNYIFLSNLRRFRELDPEQHGKCIVTSNITSDNIYLQVNYRDLLSNVQVVRDNAGLMAMKFLILYGVKEIYLAGFDGYAHDINENYGDSHLAFVTKNAILDAMNEGMTKVIKSYQNEIEIHFLTKPRNIRIL